VWLSSSYQMRISDSGTHVTILGKPKFVTLADEIHNKKVFLKCLKNR